MRDKWDKRHGKDTYGNITLDKAISGCSTIYEPKPEYEVKIGCAVPTRQKLYTFDDTGNAQRMYDTFGEKNQIQLCKQRVDVLRRTKMV